MSTAANKPPLCGTPLDEISRQLRTPLTDVLGMAHLLNETILNDDQREYVQAIMRASHELLVRVDNTLDLSQLNDDSLAVHEGYFSITETLLIMIERIRPSALNKKLDISLDIAPNVDTKIQCDKARMSQAVFNLTAHIISWHKNGNIRVAAGIQKDQWGHNLCVTVSAEAIPDKGKAANLQDGHALEVTKRLARLMGGEVIMEELKSVPTQGELSIRVEASDTEEEHVPVSARILVAEDSRANQRLIGLILNKLGHEFEMVDDGLAAVEAARNNRYDLILMDLHMPHMDGMEASKQIRAFDDEACALVPIIALTADVRPQIPAMLLDAGMDAYLAKPLDVSRLSETIQSYIHAPRVNADKPSTIAKLA